MPKLINISKSSLAAKRMEQSALTMDVPPAISKLLTRQQVIQRIQMDIAKTSLTEQATKHGISPQQLSDICHGRANLSNTVLDKYSYRKWEYFEKVGSE